MSHTTVVDVLGMTCGHCIKAVTREVSALGGVRDVHVVLRPDRPSTVTVASDRALDEDALRTAVDEAGYQVDAVHAG